jgi:hypothetical protein
MVTKVLAHDIARDLRHVFCNAGPAAHKFAAGMMAHAWQNTFSGVAVLSLDENRKDVRRLRARAEAPDRAAIKMVINFFLDFDFQ